MAHLGLVIEQRNGHGVAVRRGLVGILQNQSGTVGIVVVDNDGVELLFCQPAQPIRISTALYSQAKSRQRRRENTRRLFVFTNQKRLKCHKRALCVGQCEPDKSVFVQSAVQSTSCKPGST